MYNMDKRLYSCLVIAYVIKTSMATFCTIRNDGHCFYTVNCDIPARINIVPYCNYTDPYIALVINKSPIHNVTPNFFNTKFDPYVRILTAVGNSWDVVQNYAFSNFKNVLYIDFSRNHIKSLGKAFSSLGQLDSLNLSRNHINEIKPEVFKFSENKSRLLLLDLSFNLLTYLSEDFFVNMHNLRRLYLQGNKLTMLGDQYSTNLKNLDYLNLCCSNLRTFNISLKHLTVLRELDLSFNNLKTVDLSEVESLETINLSHNDIEELMFDYFNRFPKLAVLDLSYNKFKNIFGSGNATNQSTNQETMPLIRIYLSHNKIRHIDKTFFLALSYIRHLNLSHNDIREIKAGTFQHVKILRVLIISNCRLELTEGTFDGLNNTVLIDISGNNLTTLDAMSFSECTELRRIEADYNQIRTVDVKKFMDVVPSLTRITLEGNSKDDVNIKILPLIERTVDLVMEIHCIILVILLLFGATSLALLLLLMFVGIYQRVVFVIL